MRYYFWILVFSMTLLGCNDGHKEKGNTQTEAGKVQPEKSEDSSPTQFETYRNEKWHFALEFPKKLRVLESELAGKTPVINLYDPTNKTEPPYAIHEAATAAYISVLPEGYGVDAPNGTRKSFREWNGNLPVSFEINREESMVYLLENGKPWAATLRFHSPPPGWSEYGSIFVHYAVEDFSTECFDEASNETVPLKKCDPMGKDRIKYSGQISIEKKEVLNAVLESLYFTSELEKRKAISEIIKVERPLPNQDIKSPLKITGKARGFWFFEGSAPLKLVDKDLKILATGYVSAKGEWMTEDFVPFEGELKFESPDDERGYLIFSRANASGKPEHDRVYRIPVLFPPKK